MFSQNKLTIEKLISEIKSFKEKEQKVDLNIYKQNLLNQIKNLSEIQASVDLLLLGIRIYQETENADLALDKINQSIQKYPTADAYFNKGVIQHCIGNYYECFLSVSTSIILDNTNIPKAYFYRSYALYALCSEMTQKTISAEMVLLDFIIEDLFKAAKLGVDGATEMLKNITIQRMELYDKF